MRAAIWTTDELERIGESEELELASRGADGSRSGFVTMWVVRVDGELYVRSAHGPTNPWYRRALDRSVGTIRANGIEREVTFAAAAPSDHEAIDSSYHAKYDRYGPKIVGSVVGADAHRVTIRLVPAGQER